MTQHLRLAAASVVLALCATAAVVGESSPEARFEALAAALGQGRPLMRIGLEPASAIRVTARGGFRVLDVTTGEPVWRARFDGPLQVVTEGAPAGGVRVVHRVQVGAYQTAEAAATELERLERTFETSGIVHHDPDRGNWRVRLGREDDRLALNPLVEQLRAAGFEGVWVAEEPATVAAGVTLRLVDASWASEATGRERLALVPVGKGRIEIDGKAYRGAIELRVTPFGTLRPINWVELEQYLLGVVPAEMGPEVWPQLEALKAQAVAARTYAWRNRGQFLNEGFDLCATPRCQVYEGANAEHPLTDRAVAETRGEIAISENRPIVALYTATCGGHTEDGGEIFPEHRESYLKGVPCRAEVDALATQRAEVEGRRQEPRLDESGADVTRDFGLLVAAGVVDERDGNAKTVGAAELRRATAAVARLAGRPAPAGAARKAETLGQAGEAVVADLGWSDRATVLLAAEDTAALLRDDDAAGLPPGERQALAYLAWSEALRPFPDGRFHVERAPTLARLAPALVRIGDSYEAFGLRDGVFGGKATGALRIVRGKGEVRLPLAARPHLFGLVAGRAVPVERLELWPGDRLRYRTNGDGRIDFLELAPPVKGTADDRSAKLFSWEERKTRRELETTINRRVSVGTLRDLQVVRRGVSGRVVELKVVGSTGSTTVRGFDVRRLLDLREILVVLEIQRDAAGAIEAVVFAGKGWGHGVGLCQVGAYGMALRGATYREILAHYYTGAGLERLAADVR